MTLCDTMAVVEKTAEALTPNASGAMRTFINVNQFVAQALVVPFPMIVHEECHRINGLTIQNAGPVAASERVRE